MLEELKVRDLIGERDRVYFVDAEDTADVAALKLRNFKVRTTGVMKGGRIVGVVGHSDFATKLVALGKKPSEVRIAEIMSDVLHKVTLESSFYECLDLMNEHGISHLFILDRKGSITACSRGPTCRGYSAKELKYQLKVAQEYAFWARTL